MHLEVAATNLGDVIEWTVRWAETDEPWDAVNEKVVRGTQARMVGMAIEDELILAIEAVAHDLGGTRPKKNPSRHAVTGLPGKDSKV